MSGSVVGVLGGVGVGVAAGLFLLNLYRLLHAGTGYAIHSSIEGLATWKPARLGVMVFVLLGAMLTQPFVILLSSLVLQLQENTFGIVGVTKAIWQQPIGAAIASAAITSIIAAPAWLRRVVPSPVRAYEMERWIDERIEVDAHYVDAQEVIAHHLQQEVGVSGPLTTHFADPPYNKQPLLFGLDPSGIRRGQIRLDAPIQPPPVAAAPMPAQVAPPIVVETLPIAAPPKLPRAAAEVLPIAATASPQTLGLQGIATPPQAAGDLDDSSDDDNVAPPRVAYFELGRLLPDRARAHIDEIVPFIAVLTERPPAEVRATIAAAPDDMRLHRLFPEWKRLPYLLTKTAGFARTYGLAPILAIVVDLPVVEVERRLSAAPADRRITGVFAGELAKRLLRQKKPTP